jgi:hypothetical protein
LVVGVDCAKKGEGKLRDVSTAASGVVAEAACELEPECVVAELTVNCLLLCPLVPTAGDGGPEAVVVEAVPGLVGPPSDEAERLDGVAATGPVAVEGRLELSG